MMLRIASRWVVMMVFFLIGCGSDEGTREQMVNLEAVAVEDPEKQLSDLTEAIARSKRDGSLYARRAMVLLRKGEFDSALSDADMAINLSSDQPANYFVKAQALYLMGRPDEALPLALQAERNSYQTTSLNVLLAELYIQRKAYTQAGHYIRQALELSPDDAYASYYHGRILEATGDTTQAVKSYQRALKAKSDFMQPHRELAGLYLALQEPTQAREHVKRAGQMAPNDAQVWYYRGLLQLSSQKRDSAQYSFNQALALNDTLQQAHYQLGLLHHGRGEYEMALEHLDQARKSYGSSLRYLSVRASSLERTGENLAALRAYERIVAIEPKHTYALQSIARLKYRLERPRPQLDSMAVRHRGF